MPFEALKEFVSPLIKRSPFKPAKNDPVMPAPVQDADNSDAGSPLQRKSNAWPTEERDDIYNRRQQGEKWDTICLDYPHRSKHAMQQQYSIMKKQAILKTPTKGRGRRKGKPLAVASPTVMNAKKQSTRRASPEEDADQSNAESDDESEASDPSNLRGGHDSTLETDNESESAKEPDSARKQRLRRRLRQTDGNDDDEDEQPVSTRPKRTRASGVNYNLLQNSGYGLEDQADDATAEPSTDVPVRKSKIVALKMGIPKTPVVDQARRPSKAFSIDGIEDSMPEDASTRRSQRVKRVSNAKAEHLNADEATHQSRGQRKGRSLLPQEAEADPTIEDDSDVRNTRSKKRKHSLAESNGTPQQKAGESAAETETLPSTKKRRQGKPKEHLGFLPNGQPRQRRRRRTRAEMEADERTTPATTSVSRRRSNYQFPFLEGYNGPPPPDMAAIMARQEEHERQNPPRESDSEPESTSSSLQSLNDDEEEATNDQPPKATVVDTAPANTVVIATTTPNNVNTNANASANINAITSAGLDGEVSPLTRPPVDQQLSATAAEYNEERHYQLLQKHSPADVYGPDHPTVRKMAARARETARESPTKAATSSADHTLDIPDVVFFAEDIEKARENARKLRALSDEQTTASMTKLALVETNLEKERLHNQEISQQLDNLRKEHVGCESKAQDAKAVAQQLRGLKEIENLYDEALEKQSASEKAVAEERKRNADLEEELSSMRTQSLLREKNFEGQIAELTKSAASEKKSAPPDEAVKKQIDHLTQLWNESKTEKEGLLKKQAELISSNDILRNNQKELKADNTRLDQKLADLTSEYETLLNQRTSRNPKNSLTAINTKDGATDITPIAPAPAPKSNLSSPGLAFFTDLISGRSSPAPSTIPITTIKPHLELIRKTHRNIGYHLKVSSGAHTTHDEALTKLLGELEEEEITMRKVKERVKELVGGSEKVGKGIKSSMDESEVAKGRVMGLWDVVEPPSKY